FNPVQLVDSKPKHKGLMDPTVVGKGNSRQRPAQDAIGQRKEEEGGKDDELYEDPLKALDDIAKNEKLEEAKVVSPLNPFDPRSVSAPEVAETEATQNSAGAAPAAQEKGDARMTQLKNDLDQIVLKEAQQGRIAPRIELKKTEEGVLISLTDDANFSMFAVGSIEPRPQLVRIIGEIGKALARQKGEIEIGGHTDSRSYSSRKYDNWRLSSDRATIVNYMLVRGGLSAARVGKIVGHADHKLKMPNNPLAPINRRIEILLRDEKP
ncbi:MAG: OmpA family protein, partial [Methylocystis sp.]|nr:OmpA family protein [Methylocystis sp.]